MSGPGAERGRQRWRRQAGEGERPGRRAGEGFAAWNKLVKAAGAIYVGPYCYC